MNKNLRLLLLLAQYPLLLSTSSLSYALPEYNSTAGGSVTLDNSISGTLAIHQQTSNAIVNWDQFNIGSGETVNVYQPSSSSILLNRVLDQNPTQILGNLNANGHVWIMNGGGVLFGENAQVNVGGLIATTADIDNDDFMNGNYRFNQAGLPGSSIINNGQINANNGFVGLFASKISNSGTITANMGKIVLGATETYTVDFYGDGLINVALDDLEAETAQTDSYKVTNEGDIISHAGQIEMTVAQGNATVERLIENKWTAKIEANSVGYNKEGQIVLGGGTNGRHNNTTVLVAGSVSAKGNDVGEKGGIIKILGDQVAVLNDAYIDASGAAGGGKIYIGGEYLGQGDTKTARATVIQNAYIKANGGSGEVIVWSDEFTNFMGTIEANDGGGFVETSSKDILLATGRVYAEGGSWLLDPGDITVRDDAGGGPDDSTISGPVFDSAGVASIVTTEAIEAALAGADVTIQTSGIGGGFGHITIADAIEYTGAFERTLTFKADGIIEADMFSIDSTSTGALNVVLWADAAGGAIDGAVDLSNGTINTNGGDFIIGGGANPYTDSLIGLDFMHGVWIRDVVINVDNPLSSTDDGIISLRAESASTNHSFKAGIRLSNVDLQADVGNIYIEGINNYTGTDNVGLWIESSSTIQTVSGNIDLIGLNNTPSANNRGVHITVGSQILQSGVGSSGYVNIEGTAALSNLEGVRISDQSAISIADADLSITSHMGDLYITGQILKSTGGDKSIELRSDDDIYMEYQWPGTDFISTSGKMDISLVADADNDGSGDLETHDSNFDTNGGNFLASGQNVILATTNITSNFGGTGNISLTADTLAMTGTTLDAAENVTIKTKSNSTNMNIGGGAGGLDLSTLELAMISTGNSLILGDSGTGLGNVLVDNVNVVGGGYNLEVYGGEITVENGLTGAGSILLSSRDGNNINVNSVITAGGAGNSLIVNATGDFINTYGLGALDPSAGRYIIYSANQNTINLGGLTGDVILNETIQTRAPASIAGTNNTIVYALSSAPSSGEEVDTPIINAELLVDPQLPQYSGPQGDYYVQTSNVAANVSDVIYNGFFADDVGLNYSGILEALLGNSAVLIESSGYQIINSNYIPKVGDFIKTGLKADFTFESDENSIIKMARSSTLRVKKVFYSPDGKEDTYFDVKNGTVGFFSDHQTHKGEIKTILPGIAIKVTGTCYIVDHNAESEMTNITLFGGGIELYILGQLVKLHDPIQMISFGKDGPSGGSGKVQPIPLTMNDVRQMFKEKPGVIPSRDELLKCGVPEASI